MHLSFFRLLLLLTVRRHKELIVRGKAVLTRHKAECAGEVYIYSFSTWALVGMSSQLHALFALLLGKETLLPLNCKLSGPQNQAGCFAEEISWVCVESNHDTSDVHSVPKPLYRVSLQRVNCNHYEQNRSCCYFSGNQMFFEIMHASSLFVFHQILS